MDNLITNIDIIDESKNCFLEYAEEVLTDRAIPSAEDGLLSVHRKILWTMENVLKMSNKSKYKKSASIVGSTLASAYFHGDTSCYGALCKLSQAYLMRYPLIDGNGNLGTQEGNGMEAAMRYSNAKPSKFADLMYEDYNKNVVPLKPTYNEEYMEPVVLPSIFPNAICNGREAIGIGFSHNSLPHNLKEVVAAIIAYLNNNDITVEELLKEMPGPDFPLGGKVLNTQDVVAAYKTGHSTTSIKIRGDYEIKGREIIFNSIPYRTYRNKIKEQIEKHIEVLDKYLDDFSDESNVGVNKLVFKCKKDADPEYVVELLFDCTDLQTSLSYNMNFIVNGTPKLCSLKDLIQAYVEHQHRVITAAATFDKDKAEVRKHILDGLLIALGDIDTAIELIRSSQDKKEAATKLTSRFAIDEAQAKAILDMKLSRLTKLDKKDLEKELKEKVEIIKECTKLIEDKAYRIQHLIEKLEGLAKKYGDERKTELLYLKLQPKSKSKNKKVEKIIKPEPCTVIMTEDGMIKRVMTVAKTQRRNGKGVKTKKNVIKSAVITNTIDSLMLFTNKGLLYKLKVGDVPARTGAAAGVPINTLVEMQPNEHILAMTATTAVNDKDKYVTFVTKNGMVKKSLMEVYTETKRNGIVAIKLRDDDEIKSVMFMADEDIMMVTCGGRIIRFDSTSIAPVGRNAYGVRGINLDKDDYVLKGFTASAKYTDIIIFYENGKANKFEWDEIPCRGRNGKGVKMCADATVVSAVKVNDSNTILIVGTPNSICIKADEIPKHHRQAAGTLVIKDSTINSCVVTS